MTRRSLFLITLIVLIGPAILSPSPKKDKEAKNKEAHPHHDKKHKRHGDSHNETEPEEIPDEGWNYENTTAVDNRRILFSKRTEKAKRPYMVYLQLTKESAKAHKYRGWLCGGVVVDHYYVLTSAACVEDADRFYIVSGTTKFVDSFDYKNDECVCKHRRKVVWKCIPKNYKFDFQDSIKWSSNDIAIVKVDKPFKLGTQEKGCEFAVCPIQYNNISRELEKPGTKGWIAGWGSGNNFREGVYRRQKETVHIPKNAKCLQEAKVCIMDNEQCAKKWAQRFREIITQYMICTKDVMKRLSEVCDKKYANCTDVERRYDDTLSNSVSVDLGRHLRDPDDYTARRSTLQGGFCENDHGGPLIIKYKNKETVIGVISACKIDPKSHSCHGPFLYTSVYKNRQFISCAIHKEVEGDNCRRVFRSGITHEEWNVSWENVNDDGELINNNNKAAAATEAKSSSESDDESREHLRVGDKTEEPKSGTPKAEESSSSEETTPKPTVEAVQEKKPKEETKSEKHKKKSRSKKQKGKEENGEKSNKKDSETDVKDTAPKADAPDSYESSNDETVNNPEKSE